MNKCPFLMVLLVALMTSHCPGVRALPRLITRQLTASRVPLRVASSDVCTNYMGQCVPWETKCCNNMVCMNLARGYCVYPLERCVCQKLNSDSY